MEKPLWKQKGRAIWALCFWALMLAAWQIVMFASGGWVRYVSYGSIVLCFVFVCTFFKKEKDVLFQLGAAFFTCIADFFLILLGGQHKTVAMCAFLCAQIFYAARTLLLTENAKERKINLILRGALGAVGAAATFIVLKEEAQALFVISVVYYVQLVLSVIFAFIHFKDGVKAKLLAIGLLCFSLCDITIGFDFLVDIFSLGEDSIIYRLCHTPVSFVHVFYPPSQTLLATSACPLDRTPQTAEGAEKSAS